MASTNAADILAPVRVAQAEPTVASVLLGVDARVELAVIQAGHISLL
jgi:hypothetical protein